MVYIQNFYDYVLENKYTEQVVGGARRKKRVHQRRSRRERLALLTAEVETTATDAEVIACFGEDCPEVVYLSQEAQTTLDTAK